MTPTDCTVIPTRMSQCLAAAALMGRSLRSSREPRGMEDRSAETTEAGTARSATDYPASQAVNATLKEQQMIALLQVIVVHAVGRLLARIPDTGDGVW
jgi:hypothetical protein